jgi:hypothetical protein
MVQRKTKPSPRTRKQSVNLTGEERRLIKVLQNQAEKEALERSDDEFPAITMSVILRAGLRVLSSISTQRMLKAIFALEEFKRGRPTNK